MLLADGSADKFHLRAYVRNRRHQCLEVTIALDDVFIERPVIESCVGTHRALNTILLAGLKPLIKIDRIVNVGQHRDLQCLEFVADRIHSNGLGLLIQECHLLLFASSARGCAK